MTCSATVHDLPVFRMMLANVPDGCGMVELDSERLAVANYD